MWQRRVAKLWLNYASLEAEPYQERQRHVLNECSALARSSETMQLGLLPEVVERFGWEVAPATLFRRERDMNLFNSHRVCVTGLSWKIKSDYAFLKEEMFIQSRWRRHVWNSKNQANEWARLLWNWNSLFKSLAFVIKKMRRQTSYLIFFWFGLFFWEGEETPKYCTSPHSLFYHCIKCCKMTWVKLNTQRQRETTSFYARQIPALPQGFGNLNLLDYDI